MGIITITFYIWNSIEEKKKRIRRAAIKALKINWAKRHKHSR